MQKKLQLLQATACAMQKEPSDCKAQQCHKLSILRNMILPELETLGIAAFMGVFVLRR